MEILFQPVEAVRVETGHVDASGPDGHHRTCIVASSITSST
jgi:hypothetical protein